MGGILAAPRSASSPVIDTKPRYRWWPSGARGGPPRVPASSSPPWQGRSPQPSQRSLRDRTRRQGVLARLRPVLPVRHADDPATVHEAPYILDGLLMNEIGKRVREQCPDTRAAPRTRSSQRARSSVTRSFRARGERLGHCQRSPPCGRPKMLSSPVPLAQHARVSLRLATLFYSPLPEHPSRRRPTRPRCPADTL